MANIFNKIEFGSKRIAIINPSKNGFPEKISYESLAKYMFDSNEEIKLKKPNGVISLILGNGIEFVIAFLSIVSGGFIVAPINPNFTEYEILKNLKEIDPDLIINDKNSDYLTNYCSKNKIKLLNFCQIAKKLVGGNPKKDRKNVVGFDNLACLQLYTSGTTGSPKCVRLTHENIICSVNNIAKNLKLTEKDSTLIVMPLFHVHGLIGGLLTTLFSGGTAVIPKKFSATEFWKLFSSYNNTWYTAVPTIHKIIEKTFAKTFSKLKSAEKSAIRKNLRFVRSCSSALPKDLFCSIENLLNVPVVQAYAMTEASHQISSNPLPPFKRKPESVGKPLGTDVAILSNGDFCSEHRIVGEIAIKAPSVIKSYHIRNEEDKKKNGESFAKEYFKTGDLGYFDEEGFLYINGRIKEIINKGGEKVSPFEIEAVLNKIDFVENSAIFGVQDEIYGEEICAVVIVNFEISDQNCKETELKIIRICGEKLTKFKCPKKIFFCDKIPTTVTGKVQRSKLANFCEQL